MKVGALMAALLFCAALAAGPTLAAGGGGGGSGGGGSAPGATAAGGPAGGPIEGGNDIEPAPTSVHRREKAAGIAPPAAQNRAETQSVETEAQRLIRQSEAGTSHLPPGALPAPR